MKPYPTNRYYDKLVDNNHPLVDFKKETILKWIFDSHVVEWYSTWLTHHRLSFDDMEDKCQEIYLMLAEMPEEKLRDLAEQGRHAIAAYVTGVIHRQLITTNSFIYKKYKKNKDKVVLMDDVFWEKYWNEED